LGLGTYSAVKLSDIRPTAFGGIPSRRFAMAGVVQLTNFNAPPAGGF